MKIVKNCKTCGHSEYKGFIFKELFCNLCQNDCGRILKYPASEGNNQCVKGSGWISTNILEVSFEDAEKMKMWEDLQC
jgi:hypothetical protein